MPDNTPTLKETEAACPNCGVITKISYPIEESRPVQYGTCSFCHCLWKWRKSGTEKIIDSEHQYHITIHLV